MVVMTGSIGFRDGCWWWWWWLGLCSNGGNATNCKPTHMVQSIGHVVEILAYRCDGWGCDLMEAMLQTVNPPSWFPYSPIR